MYEVFSSECLMGCLLFQFLTSLLVLLKNFKQIKPNKILYGKTYFHSFNRLNVQVCQNKAIGFVWTFSVSSHVSGSLYSASL